MGLNEGETGPDKEVKNHARVKETNISVGVKVLVVATHKFLGVILDQELRWKEHVQYALQKGTKWVTHTGGSQSR